MKMPWSNRQGPLKLLVICATVMLIALGMCGLQAVVLQALPKSGDFAVGTLLVFFYIELAAMLLSIMGIVVGLVWLVIQKISGNAK